MTNTVNLHPYEYTIAGRGWQESVLCSFTTEREADDFLIELYRNEDEWVAISYKRLW